MSKRIACVAGEPSGDMLAADLLEGLKAHSELSHADYFGIGGPKMAAKGFRSLWPIEKLSVRGYVEALRQLPAILKIRSQLISNLKADPPDIYVGIDAPDFNLGVERQCKLNGIPTVHFISPSIWAWRGGRINSIKKAVDHVLCLFPFEPAIYHAKGINATYVGHPLASEIPDDPNPDSAKDKLKSIGLLQNGPIEGDETVIAVLPGSRHSEINLIAPVFFDALNSLVHKSDKNFRFLVPVATPALKASLVNLKHELLVKNSHLKIDLIDGYSNLILEASDVVLIASGTATLEAALWKKPMVISYKVPWLTAQIMKRQGYLPYVGLPNILSGEFVVPELLQDDATPDALAQAILDWLNSPLKVSSLIERFKLMHFELKRPTAKLSAEVIASIVKAQ